ncbi:putative E1-E2 ATPase, partial [Hamiltosporidium magnivora]
MPSTQNNKQPLGIREIQIPNTTNTYPKNIIRNQKYSAITFPFVVFINQFRYFFNIYFFLICISQCFPVYSVSPLISNIGPWALVLLLTLLKEGMDDYKRYKRDKEANSEIYSTVVMGVGSVGVGDTSVGDISNVSNNISNTSISNIRDISNTSISNIRDISNTNTNISNTSISNVIDIPLTNTPSSSLKVGDIIFLKKNQRIPADCLLIKTSDPSGSCFIRTDQLDGETDWKLRTSPHITQSLTYKEILLTNLKIFADKPHKDIYSFIGKLSVG